MNAFYEEERTQGLDNRFWEQLDRLETRHQHIQNRHETARRELETATRQDVDGLREVWRRYCEVIAELDRTTAELETLRTRSGS